jgi:quinolinate synthase
VFLSSLLLLPYVAISLQERALLEEIVELRDRRKAVILAHDYQIPQIQDIADCVGDSLALSQAASNTGAEVIVFCGARAPIFSPRDSMELVTPTLPQPAMSA